VIDGGPHGYQNAGHAHADALSLTFTIQGIPFLIDPGTACYTTDPELRDRLRSSAMHNTVTIDGRSQSLPRGPFHWTHAADARVNRWATEEDFDLFDGAHDGYAPIEHRRRVLARHGDLLVVADFVNADGRHAAAAHWHLDPRWTAYLHGRDVICRAGDTRIALVVCDGSVELFHADERVHLGWYSPAYGRLEPTTTIRVTREAEGPFRIATVFGLDAANAIAGVEWIDDRTLCITRARSTDAVAFAETDARKLFRRQPNDRRPTTKDDLCAVSQVS